MTQEAIPGGFPHNLSETETARAPVPDASDHFEISFDVDDAGEPDVNDDPPPPVRLAVAAAPRPGEPDFPGRAAFRVGVAHRAVTLLGEMLIKRGGKRFYSVGAGPTFGVADRNACAAFQRAQGWTDKNADGYPGPLTWKLLVSGEGRDIPKTVAVQVLRSPVPGYQVTYPFGVRDRNYSAGWHTGADYAAPKGAPIVAVIAGTVIRADNGGAYGNWTQIRGEDGHVWMYAHQSRRAVSVSQHVRAGQVIGYVGDTGHVTGPHLHLEKSKNRTWAYAQVVKPTW